MINRWTVRDQLYDTLADEGMGAIAFSPLAQGRLTSRYLAGVPGDSRAARGGFLNTSDITPDVVARLEKLNAAAQRRGQSLAQMALSWVLKDQRLTSALIGASRPEQVRECVGALDGPAFSAADLTEIDAICGTGDNFA
jgi:L-glyceraldehyde 3-phosphate reductase